jgi:hypothetical protein
MSSPDWRLQPLRNFWQGVNWDNHTIAPLSINRSNNSGQSPAELSFLMSVTDYFRAISWTGIPEIAVATFELKSATANPIDESNETLEDFLDDVSKFF